MSKTSNSGKRFLWIPDIVWRNLLTYPISSGALIVYFELRLHVTKSGYCYIHIKTLATNLNKTRSAIIKNLKELDNHKLLKRERRGPKCDVYHVTMEPSPHSEKGGNNSTSLEEKEVEIFPKRGGNFSKRTIYNNMRTTYCESAGEEEVKKTEDDFKKKFEEIYKLYPQKGRKQRARDEYKKTLKKISHSELLQAVKDYKDSPYVQSRVNDPENKQYIPLFANWLKDNSWDAEERDRWNNAAPGWKAPKKLTADEQREIIREKIRGQICEELAECMELVKDCALLRTRMSNRPDVYEKLKLIDGTPELSNFKAYAAGLGVTLDVK